MSQSITNKLIANIKQANLNNNTNNFINSEHVICIDSSNNRIGINTRNPEYSIDIVGSTKNHGVKANYLQIDNSANINEISCNKIIIFNELSADKIDVSNLFFNEISGNDLYVNTLSAETIKISNLELPDISVNDICVNNLKILQNFVCDAPNAYLNDICVNKITIISEQDQDNVIALKLLRADLSASIKDLSFNTANGNYLNLLDFSANNINISNNAIFSSAIEVEGEASFNSIKVDGSCNLKELTINNSSIDQIMSSKINQEVALGRISNITSDIITVNDYIRIRSDSTNTSLFNFLKINNKLEFAPQAELILPSFNYSNNNYSNNSLLYDNNKNTIYIIENGQHIPFKSNNSKFIVLDISHNNLNKPLYNSVSNSWSISGENYGSMIFTKDNTNYKKFDLFLKDNMDICNNISDGVIKFDPLDFSGTSNNSDILNINANISLQLLNKNPGDIETKNYSFGIYYYTKKDIDLSINDFEDELVSSKNTIMVFDSSYNYANSSLSYIYRTKPGEDPIIGISFLIKQEQYEDLCLNNIIVHGFNATITQS